MAREFGGDAPRQIAIWCNECGAFARKLHRLTQQQGNGGGFLLRVCGLQSANARKCRLPARRIAFRPNLQALSRPKAARKHHRAICWRCVMISTSPGAQRIGLHAKIGK